MIQRSLMLSCILTGLIGVAAWANINTAGEKGVVRTIGGKTHGQAKLNVGVGVNYAQSKDKFITWDLNEKSCPNASNEASCLQGLSDQNPVKLLSSNLFLSLGLTSFWDIALSVPFYFDGTQDITDFGIGDVEFSTKLLYPKPTEERVFYQAYVLGVAAGVSGMYGKGVYPRHAYYYSDDSAGDIFTANGFAVTGMLAWTFDIGAASNFPLQISANLGGVIPNAQKAITALGNIAFEISPVDVFTIFVDLATEIRGARIIRDFENIRREMMWVTPGIRIDSPAGVYVLLAADIGLNDYTNESHKTTFTKKTDNGEDLRYSVSSVPPIGAQFSLGWAGFLSAQDDDNDGIRNDNDRCPRDPEDIDGFEDDDGCPDEDNDKDGIPDAKDKCPDNAEDTDGFEDEDGCPDVDNDGDGIPDLKDQCPNMAEDFDGFDDKDGCPDYDNDKDAVPDSLDKCPNDMEDFDKFKDDDGCPDIDNDKDGIPDLKDKCPNEPETFNNYEDEDGCPDEKPQEKKSTMPKHRILHGVTFKSGRTDLTPDSYQYLDPIVEELRKYPSIQIEIRGHTDSLGKYSTNMKLSQLRAESVRQYFVTRGIDAARLRSVGFGPSSPIADNRIAAGRSKNRRIEIVRIK